MLEVNLPFTMLLGNLKFVRAEAVVEEEDTYLYQKACLKRLCSVVITAFTFQKKRSFLHSFFIFAEPTEPIAISFIGATFLLLLDFVQIPFHIPRNHVKAHQNWNLPCVNHTFLPSKVILCMCISGASQGHLDHVRN